MVLVIIIIILWPMKRCRAKNGPIVRSKNSDNIFVMGNILKLKTIIINHEIVRISVTISPWEIRRGRKRKLGRSDDYDLIAPRAGTRMDSRCE